MNRVHNPVTGLIAGVVILLFVGIVIATCVRGDPYEKQLEKRVAALEKQQLELKGRVDGIWAEVQECERILREHGWWELPAMSEGTKLEELRKRYPLAFKDKEKDNDVVTVDDILQGEAACREYAAFLDGSLVQKENTEELTPQEQDALEVLRSAQRIQETYDKGIRP